MIVRRYVFRQGGFMHWVFEWPSGIDDGAFLFACWALNNWPQRGVLQA